MNTRESDLHILHSICPDYSLLDIQCFYDCHNCSLDECLQHIDELEIRELEGDAIVDEDTINELNTDVTAEVLTGHFSPVRQSPNDIDKMVDNVQKQLNLLSKNKKMAFHVDNGSILSRLEWSGYDVDICVDLILCELPFSKGDGEWVDASPPIYEVSPHSSAQSSPRPAKRISNQKHNAALANHFASKRSCAQNFLSPSSADPNVALISSVGSDHSSSSSSTSHSIFHHRHKPKLFDSESTCQLHARRDKSSPECLDEWALHPLNRPNCSDFAEDENHLPVIALPDRPPSLFGGRHQPEDQVDRSSKCVDASPLTDSYPSNYFHRHNPQDLTPPPPTVSPLPTYARDDGMSAAELAARAMGAFGKDFDEVRKDKLDILRALFGGPNLLGDDENLMQVLESVDWNTEAALDLSENLLKNGSVNDDDEAERGFAGGGKKKMREKSLRGLGRSLNKHDEVIKRKERINNFNKEKKMDTHLQIISDLKIAPTFSSSLQKEEYMNNKNHDKDYEHRKVNNFAEQQACQLSFSTVPHCIAALCPYFPDASSDIIGDVVRQMVDNFPSHDQVLQVTHFAVRAAFKALLEFFPDFPSRSELPAHQAVLLKCLEQPECKEESEHGCGCCETCAASQTKLCIVNGEDMSTEFNQRNQSSPHADAMCVLQEIQGNSSSISNSGKKLNSGEHSGNYWDSQSISKHKTGKLHAAAPRSDPTFQRLMSKFVLTARAFSSSLSPEERSTLIPHLSLLRRKASAAKAHSADVMFSANNALSADGLPLQTAKRALTANSKVVLRTDSQSRTDSHTPWIQVGPQQREVEIVYDKYVPGLDATLPLREAALPATIFDDSRGKGDIYDNVELTPSLLKIDLHGLFADEARLAFAHRVRAVHAAIKGSSSASYIPVSGVDLEVVTGVGHHSENGRAILPSVIIETAKSLGLAVGRGQPGCLVVKIRRGSL